MEENRGKILIYKSEKGDTKVDVYFANGELWLTQKALSELYQVSIPTINEHIKNIIEEGELKEVATIRNFLIVQIEGQRQVSREVQHLCFQMVLAVGYRVRSRIGMHFRNWASLVLTEYTKKGFVMNDERLKNPKPFGVDFFDELLERIRDIRASEKRFYEKIKDIYATSVDYDAQDEKAKLFFKTVQNKMHYSIHGHTAAEVIAIRADSLKNNMDLTSFKGAKVRKADIDIAKNYLDEDEIKALNRVVTMYLDFAEDQASQHIPMYMADWEEKLNNFLKLTGRKVLENAGNISAEQASRIAEREYEIFDQNRKQLDTDIETFINETKRLNKTTHREPKI
ncbi:MAG: virulence RhuM family protein [Marinilabiliaceae bacterium]|nr:virulence RhuM family protein [Marinilabiliaceae bacterium]